MIVDFHLHHFVTDDDFLEKRLRLMDEAEVRFTVLHAMPNLEFKGHRCGTNEDVLRAVRKHPNRFIGGLNVDPRDPDWKSVIDYFLGAGFRCIKMWPPAGYYPDEKRFAPFFEYVNSLKLPMLFHCGVTNLGPQSHSKYADPMRIEALVRQCPDISFVLAHWGGYGYLHPSWAMACANPNVYLGTATRRWGWPGVKRFIELQKMYPLHFKRIIWGTDNIFEPKEDLDAWREILPKIDRDEWADDVFGDTAARLLKLEATSLSSS